MLTKFMTELLSTALFSFVVFSTGNYLVSGAILAIIIFFTKGFAVVNPAISLSKWIEGSFSTNMLFSMFTAEFIGAILGFEVYSIVYKKGLTFRPGKK